MLLTLTTTHQPATDLGYLLHKNPARVQSFLLAYGTAHIFYPEASVRRCTAALLLDIDPIQLVRRKGEALSLEQYVNDRPYAASSFLSVALAQTMGTALNGHCAQRPELVNTPLPLEATISVVKCRGGEAFLRRLFEPLAYTVTITPHVLDEEFPAWGMSHYYTITLTQCCRLSELLNHLYVLIPVLDDEKHYWIGDDEVEKLLRRGRGWLETHPERDHITSRYLKHQRSLVREAIARLVTEEESESEESGDPESDDEVPTAAGTEAAQEQHQSLHTLRLHTVLSLLRESNARSVLDLGCGEGKLLKLLLQEKQFERIVGMDVSYRTLEIAQRRLRLERLPSKQRERVTLIHGALTYRDKRLQGFDAAAATEVIEHLDPPRLSAFERVIFECARPGMVVVTTPNAEYNVNYATLPEGRLRHADHRFEWSRAEFQTWGQRIARQYGYSVRFFPIGAQDETHGSPSQAVMFSKEQDA
ncbi:3' terminal RNA ribose 2'-O-methyltransferase Hen1 [Reticulibacter mediterranei]|uniref:Small RNA 2'-O-methyltransferase n=1 Tax=Reticulibacter mediterranei TaxID=2778369 RepID=A0A8J3MYX7_9CHLR|nr:3' terminal RNA ribose 2'-O-methyltransferase Hen1 [Reticulibacter mediterranei]GHO91312.1 3' terminal RNA ribose 2'-O-methyltransferase Hen1 [Reticulibacter mediterranei]